MKKSRVLIVDDDPWCRGYVSGVLQMVGYEVVEAHDGAKGLLVFQKDMEGFSLVLSDWSMPNLMGTEMLHRIHQINPQQKLMMMSSDPYTACKVLKKLCLDDIDVLDKSLDPDELQEAVNTAIRR